MLNFNLIIIEAIHVGLVRFERLRDAFICIVLKLNAFKALIAFPSSKTLNIIINIMVMKPSSVIILNKIKNANFINI